MQLDNFTGITTSATPVMPSYKDLLDDDNEVIPPPDTLSEAVYNTTKLSGLIVGNEYYELEDEDEILESPSPVLEVDHKETKQYGDNTKDWQLLRVMAGAHEGWVRSVAVDPVTNKWFVTGSSDSTIKVWDLATLQMKAVLTGHIMGVRSLAVSSKYPYLFSGSEDKTVRCWDLERSNSPAGCQIRDYHGHVGGIYAMALHPELDLLFTGGRDSVIRVWDVRSRAQVMVLSGHRSDISSIVSQVGDPQIVSSAMDSTIRLWDLRKQTTALTLTHHIKSIRLMVIHPHEATICSGDSGGNLKQWVLPEGQLLNEFGTPETSKIINTMAINPANNSLYAGYDDGRMEFYDYVSGDLLQAEHSTPVPGASESSIYSSAFDMLGLRLINCEGDKSIKIWGSVV